LNWRNARAGCPRHTLPTNPFGAGYQIEMAITAQEGKRMLAAECGDPKIVGGNRLALAL